MKLSKKTKQLIKNLVDSESFTDNERRLIKTYPLNYQLYILMLAPYVPQHIREQAVIIYGSFVNPSFELPKSYIIGFLDVFNLSHKDYLNTLTQIYKTKLIIY